MSDGTIATHIGQALRGKTVRVTTRNGFTVRGRVVEFDHVHMNVVLDCVDAAGVCVADSVTSGALRFVLQPPHLASAREVFIRGSSIRWLDVDAHDVQFAAR